MDAASTSVKVPIASVVPHRGVMSLLHELSHHDGSNTVCEVRLDPQSAFMRAGGVPSWVAVEYMAQAVAAHDGLEAKEKGEAGRIGFLISIRKASFPVEFFRPFQTLRISVRHLWGDEDFFTFSGEVRDGQTGALLAEAQLNFYRPANLDAFKDKKSS